MALSKKTLESFTKTYIVPSMQANIFGNFQSFWDPSTPVEKYTIDQQILIDFFQQFGSVALSKRWWNTESQYQISLSPSLLTNTTPSLHFEPIILHIDKSIIELQRQDDVFLCVDLRNPNSLEELKVGIMSLINKIEQKRNKWCIQSIFPQKK